MKKNLKNQGFGLIEIIIVVAIVSLAFGALGGLGNYSLKISNRLKNQIIATNLAAEIIEAAKAVKDENWNILAGLSLETPFHPEKTGPPQKWTLASDSENLNRFSRQAVLSQVFRDVNDNIAPTGTLDSNTKKITATVSWTEDGQNRQISLTAYLTNWKP